MTPREVVQHIADGEYDKELDSLIRVALDRRRYLQSVIATVNQSEFVPGTRVRLVDIRPKYLIGLTGTVSQLPSTRRGDLMVEFDDQSYRYVQHRFQRTVGIPASSLRRA